MGLMESNPHSEVYQTAPLPTLTESLVDINLHLEIYISKGTLKYTFKKNCWKAMKQ